MQWWCSAQDTSWSWAWRAYPGVWIFLALLGVAIWLFNRAGARAAGRVQTPTHPAFVAGLAVLWIALDWPIGALGGGYLASVHMLQFLLMTLVAAPLLLLGVSHDAQRLVNGPGILPAIVRRLTAPAMALVTFNVVTLLTHLPQMVDGLMKTQLGSFVIDLVWIAAGLLFWWPIVMREPVHKRFVSPLKMGYLMLGVMFSPVMFGLAGFLVYGQTPLYATYELAPPIPGITSQMDHQIAGLLMGVGGAVIIFVAISIIFFRWSAREA